MYSVYKPSISEVTSQKVTVKERSHCTRTAKSDFDFVQIEEYRRVNDVRKKVLFVLNLVFYLRRIVIFYYSPI